MLTLHQNREEIIQHYKSIRKQFEYLSDPLEIEDYCIQAEEFASPSKWHLGHVTWFFEAFVLKKFKEDYKPLNDMYHILFNSYYLSAGLPYLRTNRSHISRPTVKEVYEFREYIDQKMIGLLNSIDENLFPEFRELTILGLNHEQQHQELFLTDLKYNFSVNPLFPIYKNAKTKGNSVATPNLEFVEIEGGLVDIGYKNDGFIYDNERPVHKVYLRDFSLANRTITNKEYIEFIEDGGYNTHKYWLSDAWSHINKVKWEYPLYWLNRRGIWYNYKLSEGLVEVNLNEPVTHVSYYEADAFAKWAGKRLPTEFEWEFAATINKASSNEGNFVDDETLHPIGITAEEVNSESSIKLYQMTGNVWEWTSSPYTPYPGYMVLADGIGEYNAKFMNNQYVLRGGSIATPRDHFRLSYRNFFYPHERWQFTGIRLAEVF